MIDKLKRIALAIQAFRLPFLLIGLISLTSLVVIILFFPSDQENRLVIPSIVGFLWGMGTYAFILTFRSAPDNPSRSLSLLGKITLTVTRAWYWLIGVVLLIGTIAMIALTVRMTSIWLRN